MKPITAFFAACFLLPSALLTAPHGASAQTQGALNRLADDDFKKADARLNAVYKKLLARLSQPAKAKLIRAQRAWTAYRDAEIAFAAEGYKGGSMAPMVASQAAARVTESRVKDLQQYLSDYSNR